jgi:hypothetical protein
LTSGWDDHMTRGILIAGNESPLTGAAAAEASKRVEQCALALIPNRLVEPLPPEAAGSRDGEKDKYIPLQWNPGSPISARTLILAAQNRLERIDEAVLVCVPPAVRRSAPDLPSRDIEILVNDHIKGWFFLVKELSAVFRDRKAGTLALVFSDISPGTGKGETADLLGPPALAFFNAFTRSLLSSSFNEPYLTLGFSSSAAGEEAAFASHIFRILDESGGKHSGKFYKFGKLGLFGR